MEHSLKALYLPPLKLKGPEQMAIDLLLLEKSFIYKNFSIALRFYTWDGDWLSIGKNQIDIQQKWIDLSKKNKLNLVRRPSGGKAVLHSGGLTYAIIWKNPPKNKKRSYLKINQWLINGFKKAGVDLFFGRQPAPISNNNCFSTSTVADLVDQEGNKYIGSAQYWRKGHLLQHGEILMDPSKILWKEIFRTDPPKTKNNLIGKEKIIASLKESIETTWPNLAWDKYEFSQKEKDFIRHFI